MKISLQNISKYRTELYGFSIFWIMLFHFEGKYPFWAKCFLNYGNMGCELFIFASGVSLYYAMQKKPTLSTYMERRLLRVLLPVFLICSWEWVPLFLKGSGKSPLFKLLARWFCLNFWLTGEQQTWFLSFMILAYLLFPYVYSILYEKKRNFAVHTGILCGLCVLITFCIKKLTPSYYDMTEIALTRGPVFVAGCAFGRSVYKKKTIEKHTGLYLFGLVIIIVASFVVLNKKIVTGIGKRYFYLIPGVSLSVLLPQIFEFTSRYRKHRFLKYLGNASVELYLLHIMLGRHLLPKTVFFDRKNMVHYYLMLLACLILAYPASKLNGYISGIISRKLEEKPV